MGLILVPFAGIFIIIGNFFSGFIFSFNVFYVIFITGDLLKGWIVLVFSFYKAYNKINRFIDSKYENKYADDI